MAMPSLPAFRADLVARAADAAPVLVVEVKRAFPPTRDGSHDIERRALHLGAEFVLLADLDRIRLHRLGDASAQQPVLELPTQLLLDRYAPGLDKGSILEAYLARIVETWLRDVTLAVDDRPAPALDDLERVGLASRLRGGDIVAEWRGFF